MKILFVYSHFWPDSPPYANMLRTLSKDMAAKGHEVEVWAGQPGYRLADGEQRRPSMELIDGVYVRRFPRFPLWGRIALVRKLEKALFPILSVVYAFYRRLRGAQSDFVITATVPPVIQGFSGYLVARLMKAKFIYHCQDLYPEIAVAMGMINQNGLLHRFGKRMEAGTRRKAWRVIALSKDMENTITASTESSAKVAVINNFMLSSHGADKSAKDLPDKIPQTGTDKPFVFIFAGNLGHFQSLELVLEAFLLFSKERNNVLLKFLGSGKLQARLQVMASDNPAVQFVAHKPFEEALVDISSADIGIVSLEPEIYRYAYPSKTMTYFGAGIPVLCIVESESELSSTIMENHLGVVANHDLDNIVEAMRQAVDNPVCRKQQASAISSWYENHLSERFVLEQWSEMLTQTKDS